MKYGGNQVVPTLRSGTLQMQRSRCCICDSAKYADARAKKGKPCAAMALLVLVQLLQGAGTLLMQREIPEDVNLQAAQVH